MQVAGIASNIEKDAFMKADTFEMYETKLVANLALYLPQNRYGWMYCTWMG